MTADEKIKNLGIELPPRANAAGLYKPLLIDGDLAYFSGHLPFGYDGKLITGCVSVDLSLEEAGFAARMTGLNILTTLKAELGNLNRVRQVVKILGLVYAPETFSQHPLVINGCSELFRDVWGEEHGLGVRSAFGVSGLPARACVEIEGIFKLRA
jgi:enamine deaminase RidA (YjgF/YER057c/UK114 family)